MTHDAESNLCGASSYEGLFCELPFLHDGWHACVGVTENGDIVHRHWLDPIPVDGDGEAKIRIPYDK